MSGEHRIRHRARRISAIAWIALALLAGSHAACTPSAEDCHDLMPVEAGPAVPAHTPPGTRGCKAVQEGVTIQVEAVRRNLRWERGRVWVDGIETPENDLPSALAAARARHAASTLGAKTGQALRNLKDTARSFRNGFRGQQQPSSPPPAPDKPPQSPQQPPPQQP